MKAHEYFVHFEAEIKSSLRFMKPEELTPEELVKHVKQKLVGRGFKRNSIKFIGDPIVTAMTTKGKRQEAYKMKIKRTRKGKKLWKQQ